MMRVMMGLLFTVIAFGVGGLARDRCASADVVAAVSFAQGTIDSLGPSEFTVTSVTGLHTRVRTTEATFILDQLPAGFEDIKVGDFMRVLANRGAGGSLAAAYIHIFAPGVRERMGIREGLHPAECLPNEGPSHHLERRPPACVEVTHYVSHVVGRTVSLAFQEGSVTITVPSNSVIHRLLRLVPGDMSTGMRVTVRGSKNADGSITAEFGRLRGLGRSEGPDIIAERLRLAQIEREMMASRLAERPPGRFKEVGHRFRR